MENRIAYKKQNVYLKINIYHNQASTLRFRPVLPLYRNQSIDIWGKLMGRFLYNGSTGLKIQHILLKKNYDCRNS